MQDVSFVSLFCEGFQSPPATPIQAKEGRHSVHQSEVATPILGVPDAGACVTPLPSHIPRGFSASTPAGLSTMGSAEINEIISGLAVSPVAISRNSLSLISPDLCGKTESGMSISLSELPGVDNGLLLPTSRSADNDAFSATASPGMSVGLSPGLCAPSMPTPKKAWPDTRFSP